MKFFNIKLACIFIIAMFCFAPLSAADLNQDGNNNKYIDQDDNNTKHIDQDIDGNEIDVEKISTDIGDDSSEEVDDADDSGIKETALNDLKDNKIDDSDIELKDSQNQDLKSRSPNLRANIKDIHVGEVPVVEVYADPELYARVSMECPGFEHAYKVNIKDGYLKYQFDEYDLKEGTYDVKLSVMGDDEFSPQEITESFHVSRYESNLKVETIRDVFPGGKALIAVSGNKDFNGTVDVMLNSDTIPVNVVDGYGSVSLYNLTPGEYKAVLDFKGDEKFTPSKSESSFTVHEGKLDPNIRLQIDDVYQGQVPVLKVYANEKLVYYDLEARCPDFCNILGYYEVDIKNGYGEVNLNNEKFLSPGNYTVTIKYPGTNQFNAQVASTTFEVHKKNNNNPDLNINVEDVNKGEELTVDISANKMFEGQVRVHVNNSEYDATKDVKVENGHGQVTFDDSFKVGNYVATVSFDGDDHFKADEKSTYFRVKGATPNITVSADDIYVNENPTVHIKTSFRIPTKLKVLLIKDSTVITSNSVEVSNEKTITLHERITDPGEYSIRVIFESNEEYEACESTATFNVSKKPVDLIDPDLSIKVDDIDEGEKAVAVVAANESLTGDARVYINGSNAVYPVHIAGGVGSVTIGDNLVPGLYNATVKFAGDDTFKAAESSAIFKVNEKKPALIDPKLKINVKDIKYGEKAVVSISTDARFSGFVGVDIGFKHYNVKVAKGKGSLKVSGLAVGKYLAKARFKQTDIFKASTKSTKFAVKKANVKITANNKGFWYFQKVKKYSVILKDNKGKALKAKKLTLKINGITYSAKTNSKGVATFKLTKLNKIGSKMAVIRYAGDKSFNKASKKATITVKFFIISAGN